MIFSINCLNKYNGNGNIYKISIIDAGYKKEDLHQK